jgi:2-C-methyl-D-erythritol 4-phosphate cytidylyltransferase / 2-C-methyl-D-erythritol 2,4-cyclodiphosphate synthase
MTTAAIIVAAGRGLRAGGGLPKQWRDLAGRPVLAHTLDALRAPGLVGPVVLVIHPDDAARAAIFEGVIVVEGGATREASVRAGLEALVPLAPEVVLIHDAARPVLRPEVTRRVIAALAVHEGAAPAVAVTDALWRGGGAGHRHTGPRGAVAGADAAGVSLWSDSGGASRSCRPCRR